MTRPTHRSNDTGKQPALHARRVPLTNDGWNVVERSHKARQSTHNKAVPPESFQQDSKAETAWRQLEPPQESVAIPRQLLMLTGRQEYETIAQNRNTYLFPYHDRNGNHFGIWGDTRAVAATRQAVLDWVGREMPSKQAAGLTKYSKVQSLTGRQLEKSEQAWRRDVNRHMLRQYPPANMGFQAIGTYVWPGKEFKPEDVLGHNLEALDRVRMDSACYILPGENGEIQVLGDVKAVPSALQRIRKACFQVQARQVRAFSIYLLYWESNDGLPDRVTLEPYNHPIVSVTNRAGHQRTGVSYLGGCRDEDQSKRAGETNQRSLRLIEFMAMKTISKLHYYRAFIHMRLRLGRFIAMEHRKPMNDSHYKLDEFESMIKQSQFVGEVTREIGDKRSESTCLKALQNADDLLSPHDAMVEALSEVNPVYSAVFTFDDPAGVLQLSVSWQEAPEAGGSTSTCAQVSRRWIKLDPDSRSATPLIDISLVHLKYGSAWHFDMQASQVMEEKRLSGDLVGFGRSVGIDVALARDPQNDKSFVKHRWHKNLASVEQRTAFRYQLGQSDYTLELTKFQRREFARKSSLATSNAEDTVSENRWSIAVYNLEWDKMLNVNERLPIGEGADWPDDASSWFPEDTSWDQQSSKRGHKGLEQLLEKLESVEQLVRQSHNGQHTGMQVG